MPVARSMRRVRRSRLRRFVEWFGGALAFALVLGVGSVTAGFIGRTVWELARIGWGIDR